MHIQTYSSKFLHYPGIFRYTVQGFPNWVDCWGQFGQNGQKLHENDKIGIFGSKQWEGGMGGVGGGFG